MCDIAIFISNTIICYAFSYFSMLHNILFCLSISILSNHSSYIYARTYTRMCAASCSSTICAIKSLHFFLSLQCNIYVKYNGSCAEIASENVFPVTKTRTGICRHARRGNDDGIIIWGNVMCAPRSIANIKTPVPEILLKLLYYL